MSFLETMRKPSLTERNEFCSLRRPKFESLTWIIFGKLFSTQRNLYFMNLGILPACMPALLVSLVLKEARKIMLSPPDSELHTVVSGSVGAENRTQTLCISSKCS